VPTTRKPYTSDVSDTEWEFVAPYLILITAEAPQRHHDLREVFNGLHCLVKTGCPWRDLPHDLPPWPAVYQQSIRWFQADVFEAIVHDLRAILRLAEDRNAQPSAAIFDGQVLQSTPESGHRSAFNGHKHKKGSKIHMAVDTLGHLLALTVTAANQDERTQIQALCRKVQEVTGNNITLVYGDSGYNGRTPLI
jgi:transposase